LVFVSFTPGKKQRKVKPAAQAPFGHVQSVREVSYYAKVDSFGSITKGDIIKEEEYTHRGRNFDRKPMQYKAPIFPIFVWKYDVYGNETEYDECRANGKPSCEKIFTYYETGDEKEIIDSVFPYQCSTPYTGIQKYVNRYDRNGNILISDFYVNNESQFVWRVVNKYNSHGRLVQVTHYTSDTINPGEITYNTYNARGELVDSDERTRQGTPPAMASVENTHFWYDDNGRLYDQATYQANQGLAKDVKIKYDASGKTITTCSYQNRVFLGTVIKTIFASTGTTRENVYGADGLLNQYVISHDSANQLMDQRVFDITYKTTMGPDDQYHRSAPGDTEMTQHIINDSHFNIVLDDYFAMNGTPIHHKSYQYTYDAKGNWITRIEFDNNEAFRIKEREIVYYKD
jgi:hypothetical protein